MTKVLWAPNPGPQTSFLQSTAREVLYGGAAAGGKSDALIIAPLRFIENPNHRALILRRTRRELQELIDRTKVIYPEICPDAGFNEQRVRWTFPYGSYIQMGFAEHADDILNQKSNQYNWIGFDELTTFEKKMYDFMLSRNRTVDPTLPLMMRSATNPGDIGHDWVFQRFVKDQEPYKIRHIPMILPDGTETFTTRQFIPATVYDNPKLADAESYIAGMMQMGEDLAAAMLYGRWDVFEGQFFRKLPVTKDVQASLLDPDQYYIIRCLDWGIVNPTAVYWLAVYPKLQKIDIIAELYVTEMVVPEICRLIQKVEQDLAHEGITQNPRISVADPNSLFKREATSQQTIAQMMSRHGVHFVPANDDRPAGWAMLRMVLETEKLRVWPGRAPMLMRTLPTLKYDPNNKDEIYHKGRVQDHAADSLRYGLLAWYEQPGAVAKPKPQDPTKIDTLWPRLQDQWAKGRFETFEGLGKGF